MNPSENVSQMSPQAQGNGGSNINYTPLNTGTSGIGSISPYSPTLRDMECSLDHYMSRLPELCLNRRYKAMERLLITEILPLTHKLLELQRD